ncbi:MAG: STAS domain-containing protein [Bacteroidetes bacterium]|nr:STAS domain-containing protein [Bacteroidota bacterium]
MIKSERSGNVEVVTLEIDTINALVADEIRKEVSGMFENGTSRMVINLKGVKYIDSSGFGCLLAITRSAKNNFGTVIFCNIEPEVQKVLEMLHLHTVFNICSSLEESINSF